MLNHRLLGRGMQPMTPACSQQHGCSHAGQHQQGMCACTEYEERGAKGRQITVPTVDVDTQTARRRPRA